MSVVAAMKHPGCIYVAADSRMTHDCGVEVTKRKLHAAEGRPVVWGTVGDSGIGERFGAWVRAFEWTSSTTWESFAFAAAAELARHNGKKRELATLAGVDPKENDTTVALLAGYIGGHQAVFELTDRGAVEELDERFLAIGSGRAHAYIANGTLELIRAGFSRESEWLEAIVNVAARFAPDCGQPVHAFRVTPEGAAPFDTWGR